MRIPSALLVDLLVVTASAVGAFLLRFDLDAAAYWRVSLLPFLAAALIVKPLTFAAFGLYRPDRGATSFRDLTQVALAVAMSSAIMAAVVVVALATGGAVWFSRAVVVLDGLLTGCLAAGVRVVARLVAEAEAVNPDDRRPRRRAIIAGAGDSGLVVARDLLRNTGLDFTPVGFVDDDPAKQGKKIYGIPVLGDITRLSEAIERARATEVIIAMPRAAGGVLRSIADICRGAGIPARTVPGLFELLHDPVRASGLRPIDVSDLLRRPQVVSDPPQLTYIQGRVVLVTGAGGSIGRELCRQVAYSSPSTVVMVGHGENSVFDAHLALRADFPSLDFVPVIADIRDTRRIAGVFAEHRPAVVFHAAAYKHVPLMEEHPEEAVANNVLGTSSVVDAAIRFGTERLVMISTDKAVSPRSVMGASKRVAESVVRSAGSRYQRAFVVARFGNVLGSRGSAFAVFRQQIAAGGPLTITHPEMRRYFMTIPEAVHLALQAGGQGRRGELFVLDMGEPIKVLDLVRDLVRLSGLSPGQIPIVVTGIRPGEKLEEALWEEGARIESTAVPDVVTVHEPSELFGFDVDVVVGELSDAVAHADRRRIGQILMRAIPGFVPGEWASAARLRPVGPASIKVARRVVH